MRFKVQLELADELAKRMKKPGAAALGRELRINAKQVGRFVQGNWTDITPAQMQRLASWARSNKIDPEVFSFRRPHPVWETFDESTAKLILGCDSHGWVNPQDDSGRSTFNKFLAQDNCRPVDVKFETPQDAASRHALAGRVRDLMAHHNCVFICGPRGNAATEVACSLLWGAQPFSTDDAERKKLPFHLRYYSDKPETLDSSCASISTDPTSRALVLQGRTLAFPFLPEAIWETAASPRFDFAVTVFCRKPVFAKADVTTVVVMGLTGFATRTACESLAAEELFVSNLEHGVPEFRIYCAKFRRTGGKDNREISDGSKWVGPPWKFPSDAVGRARRKHITEEADSES